MNRINGSEIALKVRGEIGDRVKKLTGRKPCLAVMIVGNDPASQIYVNRKVQACEKAGIHSLYLSRPDSLTENELLKQIDEWNENPEVDGILIQLPLPRQIREEVVISRIDPKKDIDGFHPLNLGKLLAGDESGFLPCTPYGIQELLIRAKIETEGKHVVIVGRSNIVGKPMAALLMQNKPGGNATVTVAHSRTRNLKELCKEADILIAAIGKPNFITEEMVKKGAVVIDVGINQVEDASKKKGYRIVGDVDYDSVSPKCSAITPVPGGVGPMTIAMLLQNTLTSYLRRENLS